jgi:polysaccharide biosynthesis protein PelA
MGQAKGKLMKQLIPIQVISISAGLLLFLALINPIQIFTIQDSLASYMDPKKLATISGKKIKREVLALYDSTELESPQYEKTMIHKNLTRILHYYGLKVVYVDIAKGLPAKLNDPKFMQRFRGMVTWFTDTRITKPRIYLRWLKKRLNEGMPYILLGQIGATSDRKGREVRLSTINTTFRSFGIKFYNDFIENPLMIKLPKNRDSYLVEFERNLVNEMTNLQKVRSFRKENKVWLHLGMHGDDYGSDPVVITRNGGYAQNLYEVFTNPVDWTFQWRINPFEFVKQAFRLELEPIGDNNMLCGRRILLVHIDGDGYVNVSYTDRKSFSGTVIKEKIIEKYKFPTTASVIVAEVNPKYLGTTGVHAEVKSLYQLDYVEPASHTYFHPLSWNKIPTISEHNVYKSAIKKGRRSILAYGKVTDELDYRHETVVSMDYIQDNFLTGRKKINVLLWSGSCLPPEEALGHLEKRNFLNMNGGDSRLDKIFNSLTHLSPIYKQVGKYVQVHAPNANENLYTNLWTGPFGGFRGVVETFKRTAEPRLLSPMNIYYHFYSGEHVSSVSALEFIYDWVEKKNPIPIFASDYIKIVRGFVSMESYKVSPNSWKITNYGNLSTIRFQETLLYPDYQKSINVIGHKHHQGNLYVFLKNSQGSDAETLITLTNKKPQVPYIKSCTGMVDWWEHQAKAQHKIRVAGRARVPFELDIALPPQLAQKKWQEQFGHEIEKEDTPQQISLETKAMGSFALQLESD